MLTGILLFFLFLCLISGSSQAVSSASGKLAASRTKTKIHHSEFQQVGSNYNFFFFGKGQKKCFESVVTVVNRSGVVCGSAGRAFVNRRAGGLIPTPDLDPRQIMKVLYECSLSEMPCFVWWQLKKAKTITEKKKKSSFKGSCVQKRSTPLWYVRIKGGRKSKLTFPDMQWEKSSSRFHPIWHICGVIVALGLSKQARWHLIQKKHKNSPNVLITRWVFFFFFAR